MRVSGVFISYSFIILYCTPSLLGTIQWNSFCHPRMQINGIGCRHHGEYHWEKAERQQEQLLQNRPMVINSVCPRNSRNIINKRPISQCVLYRSCNTLVSIVSMERRDGIVINGTKAYYLISNVQSKIQRRTFIHSMIMKLHSLLLVLIAVPTSTPLR